MKLYKCTKCSTWIKLKFIKGYVHLTCPTCGKRYELDQTSLKKYMLIPLLCVISAVYTSMTFLEGKTIDIKFIYIIGMSFLLSGIIGYLAVHMKWLTYEEKKNG